MRYKDDIRGSVEIYQDDQPYVANRSVEDIPNPFTGTRHIKSPFRLGQYLKKKSKDMDDFPDAATATANSEAQQFAQHQDDN